MKKIVALLLAVSMIFVFAACSKNADDKGGNSAEITDALSVLNAIWGSYEDGDKFPVAGGDMSEENMNMEGPGKYALEDAAVMDSAFGLPESAFTMVDDAASLMNMMNANTFTCAAFHVVKSSDVSAVVSALKDNIADRQWMCGMPDELLIITVGDYVISAFGANEIMETFKANTTAVFAKADVAVESPIVE